MDMDGCGWVEMDADGCDRVYADGGTQNKAKRGTNASAMQYLVMHDHGKKITLVLGWQKNRTDIAISILLGG